MKNKLYIFFVLWALPMMAQQRVTTSIDSTKHKIGAEFKLTIKANVDTLSKVAFPQGKQFGALEVIRSYPIDTIRNRDRYELVKKFGLTQFDSGTYVIPRLPVVINGKPVFTDSMRVEVANVAVDTLKRKLYDIKDIMPTKSDYSRWWLYGLAIAVLGAFGYLAYRYLRQRPAEKEEEIIYKTPIEKATTLLQTLERKELIQRGEVKAYYSELTNIARTYIEEAIHIPAMESTTTELIETLQAVTRQKKMTVSAETVSNLERVLRQADLVKFAKSKPLDFEIADDRSKIERTIVTIDKSIPQAIDEEDENAEEYLRQRELLRKAALKKRRQRNIGIACALILAGIIVTYAFGGFDALTGPSTKRLLRGDWVYSEYGDPGVRVETPQVLVRQDVSKVIPKGSMDFLKDMSMFAYGSPSSDFYVTTSTAKFAAETDLTLDKALEGTTQTLELEGFQNILVKQEQFQTQQGIEGLRAYGTMSYLDKVLKTSHKFYYEIVLFKQDGGLQQVMVMHEEGDQFGQQILTRIINSIELKKVSS